MTILKIIRGSTFADALQWATGDCRLIEAVLLGHAPAVLQAAGHGLPDGWLIKIEGNRKVDPEVPRRIKVIDADTLQVPCLNAVAAGASSAVVIRANTPVDLAGYTARMQIRDKVGGTVLLELTTENGGITIDNATKKISRLIEADDTAVITWKKGVFDLEMVSGDYVIKIDSGTVEVVSEVTA